MTNLKQIYKCEICGNIIEVLHTGADALVCCGQPMKLMEPKTADWKGEKHVPYIKVEGNKATVSIGIEAGMPHPMTKEHWIEWVELIGKNNFYQRAFLKPGDEPKATFMVENTEGLWAREYCNIHFLWKYE
jgi:superoxide reductase